MATELLNAFSWKCRIPLFSSHSTFTLKFRGKTLEMTIEEMKVYSQRPSPDLPPQKLSFMYTDCSLPSSSTSHLGYTQANAAAGSSSLTGRVGRQRPIPRHPCHHCKTRRAWGPKSFSIFELFLVGGCLLFWVALYLEQYSTITQKNTDSQVSKKADRTRSEMKCTTMASCNMHLWPGEKSEYKLKSVYWS